MTSKKDIDHMSLVCPIHWQKVLEDFRLGRVVLRRIILLVLDKVTRSMYLCLLVPQTGV